MNAKRNVWQELPDLLKAKKEKVLTAADSDISSQNKSKSLLSVMDSLLASN